jgi:hypothetical protein
VNKKFEVDILSASNFTSFGFCMSGRKFSTPSYRYAFNTQEKIEELGEGHTTALYWEYDGRLGRRWNLDPKPLVGISEYACFTNSPILFSDVLGDVIKTRKGKTVTVTTTVGENNEITVDYKFEKGTSEKDKAKFIKESDRLFKALAKTKEGRQRIEFLNEVKTKVKVREGKTVNNALAHTSPPTFFKTKDSKYGKVSTSAIITVDVNEIQKFVNHSLGPKMIEGELKYAHFNFVDLTEGIGTVFGHETFHVQNSVREKGNGVHTLESGIPQFECRNMNEYRTLYNPNRVSCILDGDLNNDLIKWFKEDIKEEDKTE